MTSVRTVPWLTPADVGVIAAAIVTIVMLAGRLWQPSAAASSVEVYQGGELHERIALSRGTTVRVPGPLGTTRIEVAEGRARVVASPGRKKLCVRAGWLSASGASVTCLPNRVTLVLEGDGPPRYDSMNF